MEEYNEFRNKIDTLIRDAAKTVIPGTVSAVDEKTRTCTVKIGNVDYDDVRLYGIVNETKKGFCFIPKIGSHVLAARIESSNELFIALFSEIDKVILSIGEKAEAATEEKKEEKPYEKTNTVTLTITDGKVELSADEIAFNGGTLGGLIKISELTAKLNALIDTFNGHDHSGVITAVSGGSGAAAVGTPGNSAPPNQTADTFSQADYENTRIKH